MEFKEYPRGRVIFRAARYAKKSEVFNSYRLRLADWSSSYSETAVSHGLKEKNGSIKTDGVCKIAGSFFKKVTILSYRCSRIIKYIRCITSCGLIPDPEMVCIGR